MSIESTTLFIFHTKSRHRNREKKVRKKRHTTQVIKVGEKSHRICVFLSLVGCSFLPITQKVVLVSVSVLMRRRLRDLSVVSAQGEARKRTSFESSGSRQKQVDEAVERLTSCCLLACCLSRPIVARKLLLLLTLAAFVCDWVVAVCLLSLLLCKSQSFFSLLSVHMSQQQRDFHIDQRALKMCNAACTFHASNAFFLARSKLFSPTTIFLPIFSPSNQKPSQANSWSVRWAQQTRTKVCRLKLDTHTRLFYAQPVELLWRALLHVMCVLMWLRFAYLNLW